MSGPSRAGNPLWIAYETFAMLLGFGMLALLCLLWLPFALLLVAALAGDVLTGLGDAQDSVEAPGGEDAQALNRTKQALAVIRPRSRKVASS